MAFCRQVPNPCLNVTCRHAPCHHVLPLQGIAARLAALLQSSQAPAGCSGPLLVQNRTAAVAEEFAAANPGCQAVGAVSELAGASLVFSCLANDAATDAVGMGWRAALRRLESRLLGWLVPAYAASVGPAPGATAAQPGSPLCGLDWRLSGSCVAAPVPPMRMPCKDYTRVCPATAPVCTATPIPAPGAV